MSQDPSKLNQRQKTNHGQHGQHRANDGNGRRDHTGNSQGTPPEHTEEPSPNSRPTIVDIAREAGVSVATVSRALRDLPNVAPKTRTKVTNVAAALKYETHPQASRLASGRTQTVGVMAPLFGTWFPARALGGISTVLAQAGYDLLISLMTHLDDPQAFLREAASFCRRVDGIVLIDTALSAQGLTATSLFDRPVVALGEQLEGATSLVIDNRSAAYQAVQHLVDLVHSRIGLISGAPSEDLPHTVSHQRLEGYKAALADAGLIVDPKLRIHGDWSPKSGAVAMARLLELDHPPTAVFCMSDEMAFGALETARNAGAQVPGDISIVGFDDHDLAATFGVTTMRQGVAEMGAEAARRVLGLIGGTEQASDATFDVRLVVRSTTAGPN